MKTQTRTRNWAKTQAHALSHQKIDASKAAGFTFFDTSDERNRFEWHSHQKHQLLFVEKGVVVLQTQEGSFSAHRTQAVLLAAGERHETTVSLGSHFGSVFLDVELCPVSFSRSLLVNVDPLLRALLEEGKRWGESDEASNERSRRYHAFLADILEERGKSVIEGALPSPQSLEIKELVSMALENLGEATFSELVPRIGLPERTLRRRVASELGMSWRSFLRMARIYKASQLLDTGEQTVAEISFAVGFDSLSAFTHAFRELTGFSPSGWRNRSVA